MKPIISKMLQFEKFLTWADKTLENKTDLIGVLRKIIKLFLITLTEFKINNLSLRSGALTYTIMLSLVPMLAMSAAVVKGLGGGDHLREIAYTYINTLENTTRTKNDLESTESQATSSSVPTSLTNHLRSAIDQLFNYVDNTNFAALGTFGVAGILLSVILVLGHIEAAMNAIWKVSAGRSILRKIADYLTLLILMPISINIAFAASAFLKSPVLGAKMDVLIPTAWIRTLLLKPLPIIFIALSFYVLYIFFTNTKVKTIPAVTGALFAATLWFGMQNLYINLQVGVAKYNAIYGSFATVPLFLVWIYLGWIFILTGAQLAFACQHLKSHRLFPENHSQPSFRLAAAFDIMDHVYASFARENKLTRADILESQSPHYSTPLLEEVLQILENEAFIHISQTDNRILPKISRESFSQQEIVETMLGTQSPQTPGGQRSLEAIRAAGTSDKSNTVEESIKS